MFSVCGGMRMCFVRDSGTVREEKRAEKHCPRRPLAVRNEKQVSVASFVCEWPPNEDHARYYSKFSTGNLGEWVRVVSFDGDRLTVGVGTKLVLILYTRVLYNIVGQKLKQKNQ